MLPGAGHKVFLKPLVSPPSVGTCGTNTDLGPVEPSVAHLLLPGCGTQGGRHYFLSGMISWSTSFSDDLPCWCQWPDCRDVPKSPAGAPQSLSRPWTQSGGGHCRGATVLIHPFPSSLYTNQLLTPLCFLSPTLGWEEPGLSYSWVPSLGEPSTEQASDQSLCKECSLLLTDLYPLLCLMQLFAP